MVEYVHHTAIEIRSYIFRLIFRIAVLQRPVGILLLHLLLLLLLIIPC